MLKLPIPDIILKNIYELKPEHLTEMGITLLLMDLDNTLAKYHALSPSVQLRNWIDSMKRAGIEPFIFSNSHGNRAERFAKALSIGYVNKARKPKTEMLFDILRKKGVEAKNAAIIGDQVYTDVLCGARAGITTIAIRPIDMTNPFRFIRYGTEMPFRLAYKRRIKRNRKEGK
ncbi:MAG: YqeG family HAD IIIA-type phosphatase [Clostridiales bacterium]|jgi:HAD superfamily phosphatase (TIGR01668 family)|nr:YqeG family HAD IIIA-type phosphatase [Clostridiales bacterium]